MNKADFLSAAKLKTNSITVDGIGAITVQELTEQQTVSFLKLREKEDEGIILLIRSCVIDDDTGLPMFANADKSIIQNLGATVTNQLVDGILIVSGLKAANDKS